MTTSALIPQQAADLTHSLDAALVQLDQIAARFLATRRSDNTRNNYRRALEGYRELAAQAEVNPLMGDAVILYNAQMQKQRRDKGGNLANDTIRARLKVVQSFLSWSWAFDLTPLKPERVTDMLTMPPARKLSSRDILTTEEVRRLLDAAQDDTTRCLIRVMLDGGLRVSEAVELRAQDVYSAEDRFYLHVASGKGDKSRDVEIPPDLFRDLVQFAASNSIDILDAKDAERLLFDMHRTTAWRRVGSAAKRAGLGKKVSPHSLRHTHAHHLRLAGWPLESVDGCCTPSQSDGQ